MNDDTLIENVLEGAKKELSESLVGVYIHGSYVIGGLKPMSDIDFLVVVNKPLSFTSKVSLVSLLSSLSGEIGSGKRYIELSVVNMNNMLHNQLFSQIEFIYGEWIREELLQHDFKPAIASEYTIMIAQAIQYNVKLYGEKSLSELLRPPTLIDVQQAMIDNTDINLDLDDANNKILGIMRTIYSLKYKSFTSKGDAAQSILNEEILKDEVSLCIQSIAKQYSTGIVQNIDSKLLNLTYQELYSVYQKIRNELKFN